MRHDSEKPEVSLCSSRGGDPRNNMGERKSSAKALSLLLVSTLMLSFVPTASAAVGVSLTASPQQQEANPGENATYTITVRNTGDEDMTVSLSTSEGQEQDCAQFSSTITQISGTIAPGGSETADLTVTLTSTATGSCDTTVTATAQVAPPGVPGQPEQGDVTVTTTVGEGSSGTLTGVDLSASVTEKTYNGWNPVQWSVNVENTGQTNQTIQLSFEDNSTCQSTLSPSVDPSNVQVNTGESVMVTVEVDVPEGTEAGDHCFNLKALVTAPQTPEEASDFQRLYLEVPEMHECTAFMDSTSSAQIDPGETKSFSITFYNDGNADWTVGFSASGSKNWISTPGGSTKLLPYSNGNGQATFEFDVTPDDSLPAGSLVEFEISGLDGSTKKCSDEFSVELGQTSAGSLSLETTRIDNVEPGSSRSVLVNINNQGNGAESFSLAVSSVSGWIASFDQSSLQLEGRHSSSGSSGSAVLSITAPTDALATDELQFNVNLLSQTGDPYGSETLTVTVAASRSMTASVAADAQFGGTDETARFPVTFSNTGNIQDSYSLTVCDEPPSSNPDLCESPRWAARFSDESGSQITSATLVPGQSVTVYAEVTVEGQDEFESEDFQIRIKNQNDGTVQERFDLKVIVSNHVYQMAASLVNPGELPDMQEIDMPPGGETEFLVTVTNVGTSPYLEEAIFTIQGMEDAIEVQVLYQNGTLVGDFVELERDASETVKIVMSVKDGVENGVSGVVKVSVSSGRNAAELSTVKASITIRTHHEVAFEVDGEVDRSIDYGDVALISVNVTNLGNVEDTVRLLSSDPMRGWAIEIVDEEVILAPGETRAIEVVIKPPASLDQPDTFEFTLTAEPASSPVAAQPIDLSVSASPASGFLGTGGNLQAIGLGVLALLIFGALVSAIRNRR